MVGQPGDEMGHSQLRHILTPIPSPLTLCQAPAWPMGLLGSLSAKLLAQVQES